MRHRQAETTPSSVQAVPAALPAWTDLSTASPRQCGAASEARNCLAPSVPVSMRDLRAQVAVKSSEDRFAPVAIGQCMRLRYRRAPSLQTRESSNPDLRPGFLNVLYSWPAVSPSPLPGQRNYSNPAPDPACLGWSVEVSIQGLQSSQ